MAIRLRWKKLVMVGAGGVLVRQVQVVNSLGSAWILFPHGTANCCQEYCQGRQTLLTVNYQER